MQIYYTYAFCSTLFQTSVDQITPINDQNSINNNLSAAVSIYPSQSSSFSIVGPQI